MKINKLLAGLAALVVGVAAASAQNGTISPYSRYGYGLMSDHATSAQTAMGGVGYAMHSGRQINVMNPASYARIDSLTFLFDMGFDMSALWTSEQNGDKRVSEKNFGGGLGYITMQFPVTRYLGMSVGLLPYSSVGYAFGNSVENGITRRSGDGSLNELYLGISGRLFKGLSVGVNMSYLFGTTNNYTYAINDLGSTSLFVRETEVRDWHLTAGLQYVQQLGSDNVALGLVYSPSKKLLGHAITSVQDIDNDNNPVQQSRTSLGEGYGLAATYGIGVSYTRNYLLTVEADFTYQPWSKVKYDGAKGTLNDRYRGALGVEYRPSNRGGYFRRTQYRAGVFYEQDYIKAGTNKVRDYGVTFGFGLPVPGFKTVINLGFEWLHRRAYPTALVKENYLNITIGVNFNEMWFRKSRIY